MGKYTNVVGRSDMPFKVFIGARGVGKTYSVLADSVQKKIPFIYLRRTDNEMRTLATEYSNPVKSINTKEGTDVHVEMSKNFAFFYEEHEEVREVVGLLCALSTFSKMRGVDFSETRRIIFDEFIPEKHVRDISNEGEAFLHFYETVNRNREFDGQPPVEVYFLGNAIALNNPILLTLGLVTKIASMKVEGKSRFTDKKRGIYVELIDNPDFRDAKMNTALHNLTAGTDFSEEALNNNFVSDDTRAIQDVNMNEYKPVFGLANTFILYQHKSKPLIHCRKVKSVPAGIPHFSELDKDTMYWRYSANYRLAKLRRNITYDNYTTLIIFDSIMSR